MKLNNKRLWSLGESQHFQANDDDDNMKDRETTATRKGENAMHYACTRYKPQRLFSINASMHSILCTSGPDLAQRND